MCNYSKIKDNRRYFNVEGCDNISIILVLGLKQKSFIQIMGTFCCVFSTFAFLILFGVKFRCFSKFLLEAAYFFTKNYNTTSYNYRINRLLQIIPQIFFKSPTQKKHIMAAPVESAENHRFIPLRGRLLSG